MIFGNPYEPECWQCGEIEITAKHIKALTKPVGEINATYTFKCPNCGDIQKCQLSENNFKRLETDEVCPITDPEKQIEKELQALEQQLSEKNFSKQLKKFKKTSTKSKKKKRALHPTEEKQDEISLGSITMRKAIIFIVIVVIIAIIMVQIL